MDIKIQYRLQDEEWNRMAKLRWEDDVFPINDGFYGLVSFRVGNEEILGNSEFDMSVADLAVEMAHLVEQLSSVLVGHLQFQQSDDSLEILFEVDGETVSISHNLAPEKHWLCARTELGRAMQDFVRTFSGEAGARISDVFEWRDMEILQRFASLPTSGLETRGLTGMFPCDSSRQ